MWNVGQSRVYQTLESSLATRPGTRSARLNREGGGELAASRSSTLAEDEGGQFRPKHASRNNDRFPSTFQFLEFQIRSECEQSFFENRRSFAARTVSNYTVIPYR